MKNRILLALLTILLIHNKCFTKDFVITDFGAKGDGITNNTTIIQRLIDSCSISGGTVFFPEGDYATGTIILRSNVTIYLKTNSVWSGLPDLVVYPDVVPKVRSREDENNKSLIYCEDAENVTIMGEGKFSPNGGNEVFRNSTGDSKNRPFGIRFINCRNIVVKDISMENSAFWMQRYFQCKYVRLQNLKIYNHCNINNDGIDIDGCSNVIISDCIIDSADDAICLKSEGASETRDVTISNCVISSFATAIKMGTGSIGGFKRITISNCVIKPSESKVYNNLEAPRWGGLSGIDLMSTDGGILQDITIDNIIMDSVESAIFIKLGNRFDKLFPEAPAPKPGIVKNINISNIIASNVGHYSSTITGYPENYVMDVSFRNISISFQGGGKDEDLDTNVKEYSDRYPSSHMFQCFLPSYAFYVRHVKNLTFENVTLYLQNKDERPAFVFDDVHGLHIEKLKADLRSTSEPLIKIIYSDKILIEKVLKAYSKNQFVKTFGTVKDVIIHK